jgi:hypothetical protein
LAQLDRATAFYAENCRGAIVGEPTTVTESEQQPSQDEHQPVRRELTDALIRTLQAPKGGRLEL